jgi:hypothetical protein
MFISAGLPSLPVLTRSSLPPSQSHTCLRKANKQRDAPPPSHPWTPSPSHGPCRLNPGAPAGKVTCEKTTPGAGPRPKFLPPPSFGSYINLGLHHREQAKVLPHAHTHLTTRQFGPRKETADPNPLTESSRRSHRDSRTAQPITPRLPEKPANQRSLASPPRAEAAPEAPLCAAPPPQQYA